MQAGRSSNSQWVQSSPDRKRPDVMMDEGRAPERETINQYFPQPYTLPLCKQHRGHAIEFWRTVPNLVLVRPISRFQNKGSRGKIPEWTGNSWASSVQEWPRTKTFVSLDKFERFLVGVIDHLDEDYFCILSFIEMTEYIHTERGNQNEPWCMCVCLSTFLDARPNAWANFHEIQHTN